MAQEIGESRELWGKDVWAMAEDFAAHMKHETQPFYIVYAAKEDRGMSNRLGRGAFRQTMKAYFTRPPAILGILVWYVDHSEGKFEFVPELSSPPDIPLDPSLLSDKASDASPRVMAQGERMNVLVS